MSGASTPSGLVRETASESYHASTEIPAGAGSPRSAPEAVARQRLPPAPEAGFGLEHGARVLMERDAAQLSGV